MTYFLQLHFTVSGCSADKIGHIIEQLENLGALAVTLSDAKDDAIYEPDLHTLSIWPTTILTVLLPENFDCTKMIQTLSAQLSLEKHQFLIEKLSHQVWERICIQDFKPLKFGKNLWICPSWHTVSLPNAIIVKLDPGLAFGTGSHETTQLCLEWLSDNADNIQRKTLIDYGCGSGILGISALKLGAKQAAGIDIDPQALTAALSNAENNQVNFNVYHPTQFKLLPTQQADIIIANILANSLIDLKDDLISYLKPQGQLILSGILVKQVARIKNTYKNHPKNLLKFESSKIKNGWVRLEFKRI